MSAATGKNPFSITRGFTQPVALTKAVVGYEGNIDFARETANIGELRKTGISVWYNYNH
jgi:hypothetical protein